MELFAGQATEEGGRYGSASCCPFYEATATATLSLITSYMLVIEVLVLLKS